MRQLHQQPAAVAALAVRGHRAAVGEALQRPDGRVHQLVTGSAVHVRDQAKAATILVQLRVKQSFCWSVYHTRRRDRPKATTENIVLK